MARVLIGTSGWHYDSWRGPFFPKGLPIKHQLQYYASQFSTAELNGVPPAISPGLLAEATKITPGKRAPTVSPLDGADWVAVSVMVERKNVAQIMDQLENRGASDILVFTIVNSR